MARPHGARGLALALGAFVAGVTIRDARAMRVMRLAPARAPLPRSAHPRACAVTETAREGDASASADELAPPDGDASDPAYGTGSWETVYRADEEELAAFVQERDDQMDELQSALPPTIVASVSLDAPGVTPRELRDQTTSSIDYFSSERVPSTLIAGATLGGLFSYPLVSGEPALVSFAKRLYMLLATASLCNSLLAVFAASLAIVRLLGRSHEPMAKDPLEMMLREVPLQFLAVRVHYLSGLLSFVGALSVRMVTEYGVGSPTFAQGLLCLIGGTLCYMISLFNTNLLHFANFADLWLSYARVLCVRARERKPTWGRPVGVWGAAACAFYLAAVALIGQSTSRYLLMAYCSDSR
jgi:hypothetical protein